jgi:hypothetical protein
MLDKLPLELLDHVLDHLPPPWTTKSARERTETLLSCCLVSKRVYERSLPVLWRDIRLESEERFSAMVFLSGSDVSVNLRRSAKALIVGGEAYIVPGAVTASLRLVELFPALELSASFSGAIDLKFLATSLPSM